MKKTVSDDSKLAIIKWLNNEGKLVADKAFNESRSIYGPSTPFTEGLIADDRKRFTSPKSWKRMYKGNGIRMFEDDFVLFQIIVDDDLNIVDYHLRRPSTIQNRGDEDFLKKHGIAHWTIGRYKSL